MVYGHGAQLVQYLPRRCNPSRSRNFIHRDLEYKKRFESHHDVANAMGHSKRRSPSATISRGISLSQRQEKCSLVPRCLDTIPIASFYTRVFPPFSASGTTHIFTQSPPPTHSRRITIIRPHTSSSDSYLSTCPASYSAFIF